MLSQRGSRYTDMVSLGVSIPLTLQRGLRQDRELAARLAEASAREAEAEDVQRELEQQLQTWRLQWQAALAQRELIDRQRAPLARERVQAALAAYRAGQETLATVIEARQAELSLALERIDVELSGARAWSALTYALPRDQKAVAQGERP
jgi:outer membrane protein TolC